MIIELFFQYSYFAYLISKSTRGVVNDDGLGKILPQYVQVFHIINSYLNAVMPEQPLVEKLVRKVYLVKYLVCIIFNCSSEDNDLIMSLCVSVNSALYDEHKNKCL